MAPQGPLFSNKGDGNREESVWKATGGLVSERAAWATKQLCAHLVVNKPKIRCSSKLRLHRPPNAKTQESVPRSQDRQGQQRQTKVKCSNCESCASIEKGEGGNRKGLVSTAHLFGLIRLQGDEEATAIVALPTQPGESSYCQM
jgi:hypothetical protein